MKVEIRRRKFDGKYAVWRQNLTRDDCATAWDCIDVVGSIEAAQALRASLTVKAAS